MKKYNESTINKFLTFLDPTIRFKYENNWNDNRNIRILWREKENFAYRTGAKAFFLLMAIVYVLHAYMDIVALKPNLDKWLGYRFICALAAFLGFFHTRSKHFLLSKNPKVVLALIGIGFVFMQGLSMTWRSQVPYYFCAALSVIVTSALRMTVLNSILFLLVCNLAALPGYASRPDETILIISVSLVSLIAVVAQRSRISSDIDAFIANERSKDAYENMIAQDREVADHLSKWLPKESWRRVCESRYKEHSSILQAVDEVTRETTKFVTVLQTDIRGFTQNTKTNPSYVTTVVKRQKTHTDMIADYNGIPEVIADLVFAYFDLEPIAKSFRSAVLCGFDLAQKNLEMNQEANANSIKRNIVISFGPARVGNVGGSQGSYKITALGDCCNLLHRVDEASKQNQIIELLNVPSLILTKNAAELLINLCPEIEFKELNLNKLNVVIRDFPEERTIYLLYVNQKNFDLISQNSNLKVAEEYISWNYQSELKKIRSIVA